MCWQAGTRKRTAMLCAASSIHHSPLSQRLVTGPEDSCCRPAQIRHLLFIC